MYVFFFSMSLLFSAALLFVIEPLVAKVLLPVFGGSPSVWAVCMLFFQMVLLISYGYAWILSRFKGVFWWRMIHGLIALCSLFWLPLTVSPMVASGMPEWAILKTLLLQLGLPLLVIGSSAPLLQYAFSQLDNKKAADPYFLYAASNAGSLLALLSYPFVVERFFHIPQQFIGWNGLYLVYLVFLLSLLFIGRYRALSNDRQVVPSLLGQPIMWVVLSFIPCSLLLGVTFYITSDIAAMPLFWVVPLALYLLSFIITFSTKPCFSHAWVQRNTLFIFVFPLLSFLGHFLSIYWALMHLLNFFMLALLCHGELVQRRPLPAHLTTFYFCLALGGALAGIFNGLLAPTLFVSAYEYPLMLVLALFFLPIEIKKRDWVVLPLLFLWLLLSVWLPNQGIGHWIKSYYLMESVAIGALLIWPQSRRTLVLGVLMMLTFWLGPWFQPQSTIYQKRNFYGIKKVMAAHHTHTLMSQNTLHGFQVMDNAASLQGTLSYYGPVKPVVHAMQTIPQPLRVVIVGLGTGTLACQFHPIDRVTMIEVDKQVIALATNPQLFTYLRDCPVAELIEADGRLAIQQALDGAYDLLIMDAFSSDAIPSHLLTQEAFNLYRKKLSAQGVMLIHVSNRYVDLLPVLTTIGQSLEWIVLRKQEAPHPTLGQLPSEWVLLTPNESLAQQLMSQEHWRFVSDVGGLLWTDDYTPILPLLR